MSLDKKQRSKITKAITLNAFVFVILLILGFTYVLPKYEAIGLMVDEINTSYGKYTKTAKDGVNATQYFALLAKHTSIKKTTKDPVEIAATNAALKKPDDVTAGYLEWAQGELNSSSEYDAEIERNNRIIGSIIPTYSEITADNDVAFQKNRITLKDIVRYVEEDLLKKNKLVSYSSVGLGSISFDTTSSSTTSIGTFKLTLDVQGENRNIGNLIRFIQSSGKLPLKDGRLDDSKVSTKSTTDWSQNSDLSNLLISIKSAQFGAPLTNTSEENKASLELLFYVRGRSYSDFVEIRKKVSEQVKELAKKVEADGGLCADGTNPICKNENVFRAASSIRSIKDDVTAMDTKLTDALKATTVTDVGPELNALFDLYTSFKSLEATYQKNKAIITTVQK